MRKDSVCMSMQFAYIFLFQRKKKIYFIFPREKGRKEL